MLSWLLGLVAGTAAAAALYGPHLPTGGYRRALVALRAVAVALIVALLLDAPLGARVAPRPLTALDVSASWGQGGAGRFAEAVTRARRAAGDVVLFGDSLRVGPPPSVPSDAQTHVGPAVDRASALGRPLRVITDGQLADPEALASLPAGSTVEVLPAPLAVDVAVQSLDLPPSAAPGDTIDLRALVVSAGTAVPAVTMAARLADGTVLATAPLGALAPWSEREWRARVRVPERRGALVVQVAATAAGDAQARNDTVTTVLDLRGGPSAVFVSTAPDEDARYALALMRGALAFGVKGYLRVAPGQWREDGTLSRVDEGAVREALARAPLAVLHGDTSLFGTPRAIGRGALALVPAPDADAGEYFTETAGASPLAPALAGVPWDSLPPVLVGPAPVGTNWTALGARRARRFDERTVVAGYDAPRRVAVLPVRGLWRWQFRGGRSADAFAALWGGVFDWLAEGGVEERAVLVSSPWVREGDPITWRRGATADSAVVVRLHRDGARGETVDTLRYSDAAGVATSPPLPAGIWRASVQGGDVAFAVNASSEWLPRRPIVSRGAVPGVGAAGARPSVRDQWWWFALALALLCAEWWMRRRIGLR